MFFTEKKLSRRTEELSQKRYIHVSSIAPFDAMEGKLSESESNTFLPEFRKEGQLKLNDFFVGRDRYLWLEQTVTLPQNIDEVVKMLA